MHKHQTIASALQDVPNAKTVLIQVSGRWELEALYVSPARAMEIQANAVRLGTKAKVLPYGNLDQLLDELA